MKLAARSTITLKPTLSLIDTIAIIISLVVGASIYETPSFVAANSSSEEMFLLAWGIGGLISLIGALCYAELATTYPHPGGTYYYLKQSFGPAIASLFAWTYTIIMQPGSISLLAFVFGDYASQLWQLGTHSPSIYAAIVIMVLTGLNLLGVRQGKWTVLAIAQIVGLIVISVISLGISFSSAPVLWIDSATYTAIHAAAVAPSDLWPSSNIGLMMVFVLLTYGGWNEAAYISVEVRDGRQNIVRSLIWSISIVTVLYLLVNWALIRGLGLHRMAASQTVITDLMRSSMGEAGAVMMSFLIMVTTICSINAAIFTGSRANYAVGCDFQIFAALRRGRKSTPTNALLVQGLIALLLVIIGAFTRQGFEAMVSYTAPAFWFFFLLSGLSIFLLRRRQPTLERSFRVPLYPLTPLAFCGICAYMLQASLAYTSWGSLLGIVVLLLGLPLLWWMQKSSNSTQY